MAWGMIGGAAIGLVGNIAGGSMDAKNAAAQSQSDRELTQWQTEAARQDQAFNAQLGSNQFGAQAYNSALNSQNQMAQQMFSANYDIQNQQGRFDAFQAEFGDVKDNVNNYFRTLSASSVKAQNNDDINARMAGVDARLSQTLAERGIQSNSGIAIQMLGQNMIEGETAKVMANRNVNTEVAGAQSQYLTAQANDPLLSRAPDFNAGILTDTQRSSFVNTDNVQTSYEIPTQQALPTMPDVKAPPATGLSGFISSIF